MIYSILCGILGLVVLIIGALVLLAPILLIVIGGMLLTKGMIPIWLFLIIFIGACIVAHDTWGGKK